jgi:V/A-type H+-transporting ATPase subunit K
MADFSIAPEGLMALGAGLAIGLGAIATGMAQGAIGSSGMGLLAEKPEEFTRVLILLALPETLVIFGFVIAFLLMGKMGA